MFSNRLTSKEIVRNNSISMYEGYIYMAWLSQANFPNRRLPCSAVNVQCIECQVYHTISYTLVQYAAGMSTMRVWMF